MAGPGTPVYNPSPALQTSINQGSGIQEGNANAKSWDDVIRTDPNLKGMSPDAVTNYLRAAYGLPNTYKVGPDGKITDAHNYFARNAWWLIPTIMVGGAVVGAYAGGSGGATAATTGGATTAGTGATAAGTTAATTAGSTAAATAATVGGKTAMSPLLAQLILGYGVPAVTNLIGQRSANNANRDASQLEYDATLKALEDARNERDYEHKTEEEKRAYDRQQDLLNRQRTAEQEAYARQHGYQTEVYDQAKYADATNNARQNYGNFVQTMEPYREAGQTATQRLAQLLGQALQPYQGPTYYQVGQQAATPVNLPVLPAPRLPPEYSS